MCTDNLIFRVKYKYQVCFDIFDRVIIIENIIKYNVILN
jgi:hypothetical protein